MAYDVGGRGDQSFNDAAAAGLDKAKAELGVETKEAAAVNGENEAAREERLQQLVDAGYNHVVAVGFAYAKSVGKAAKANPDVNFAIVDDASPTQGRQRPPDHFAENEGSFLVGAAAALKSKTATSASSVASTSPSSRSSRPATSRAPRPSTRTSRSNPVPHPAAGLQRLRDPAKGKTAAEACSRGAPTWSTTLRAAPAAASSRCQGCHRLAIGVDSDQALTPPADVRPSS